MPTTFRARSLQHHSIPMRPTSLIFADAPRTASSSSSSSRSGSPPASLLAEGQDSASPAADPPEPPPEWEDALLAAELAKADERHWEGKETKIHYLPDDLDMGIYSCAKCLIPLTLQDELISKAFSGRNGRAYLMHSTINTKIGKKEDRRLLTGMHTVADLSCVQCSTSLGWVYLKATDREQEYKEGKYILEAVKVIKENKWTLREENEEGS